MSILNWIKNFFVAKEVKQKAEDTVEEIKNTVSEGVEEVKEVAEKKVQALKTRARDKLGRFLADDPDTESNEAYKDKSS